MGGVGGEGILEQAKSDFMEHIQRTWSHPVLVRISILTAKNGVMFIYFANDHSVGCVSGCGVAGVQLGKRRCFAIFRILLTWFVSEKQTNTKTKHIC